MTEADLSIAVARLSLQPGDVLVVRPTSHATGAQLREILGYMVSLPALQGVRDRIAVIPHGLELLVVNKSSLP
jgi:hypothetical protein